MAFFGRSAGTAASVGQTRERAPGPPDAQRRPLRPLHAAGALWRAARLTMGALALLYPLALLGVVISFRFIGERWWATGAALYLPRLVFAAPLPVLVVGLAALGLFRLLWTQAVALGIVLWPLMGLVLPHAVGSSGATSSGATPPIRVVSYNVDSGHAGPDRIVEQVSRYAPDIVLLQEIGQPEPLARLLRDRYATVKTSGDLLIASRYPIVSSFDPQKVQFEGRSRSPRFAQHVVDTPLGPIAFYEVHPISPRAGLIGLRRKSLIRDLLFGRLMAPPPSETFRRDTGLRTLQVEDFAELAGHEKQPVVIVGDTNLPGLSWVLNRYLSGYTDAFESAGRGFGYTFPIDRGRRPWMRIDRIMASEPLRFVHFEVGCPGTSDHLCIVADMARATH